MCVCVYVCAFVCCVIIITPSEVSLFSHHHSSSSTSLYFAPLCVFSPIIIAIIFCSSVFESGWCSNTNTHTHTHTHTHMPVQNPRMSSEESVATALRRCLAAEIVKRKELEAELKTKEAELKKKEAKASVMEKWAIHNEEWAMMERTARKHAIKLSHDLIYAHKCQTQKRKDDLDAEMKQDEENKEVFAKRLKSIESSNLPTRSECAPVPPKIV